MASTRQQLTRSFGSLQAAAVAVALVVVLGMMATQAGQAQTFTVIHDFTGGTDGSNSFAGLTVDGAGNLYGTTSEGGLGLGTVFKLKHAGSSWIFTPIYFFHGGSDGATPMARVIFGPDGNLYGTTSRGGGQQNYGTVFKLMPPATACKSALCFWTETVLYRFRGGSDGYEPLAEVVFDPPGNLYGTTDLGGTGAGCDGSGCGVVYKLTPSNGGWTETIIYSFNGGSDGALPWSEVVFDGAGKLYGTTMQGGNHNCNFGCGTVFQLALVGSGWVEHVLYFFQGGGDGYDPLAGLVLDDQGNLFGATYLGGEFGGGTIFELTASGGGWTFRVLDSLVGDAGPFATLTLYRNSLCGTTVADGAYRSGSVFCSISYDFTGGSDGDEPRSRVISDSNGHLYGTTRYGGAYDRGVVWEITP